MLRGVGRVESLLLLDLLGATVCQQPGGKSVVIVVVVFCCCFVLACYSLFVVLVAVASS